MQIPAICTRAGILGEANVSRFQSIFTKTLRSLVLETAVRELKGAGPVLVRQLAGSTVGGGNASKDKNKGGWQGWEA